MLKVNMHRDSAFPLDILGFNEDVMDRIIFTRNEFMYTDRAKNYFIPFTVENGTINFRIIGKPATYEEKIVEAVKTQKLSNGDYVASAENVNKPEIISLADNKSFKYFPHYGKYIRANSYFMLRIFNFATGTFQFRKIREDSPIPAMKYMYDKFPLYIKDSDKVNNKTLEIVFETIEYIYGFPTPSAFQIRMFAENISKVRENKNEYMSNKFSEMYSIILEEYEDEQDNEIIDGVWEEIAEIELCDLFDKPKYYTKIMAGKDKQLIPFGDIMYAIVMQHKLFLYCKNPDDILLPAHMEHGTYILPVTTG